MPRNSLKKLKDAGVNAMAVFESNLDELGLTGDVTMYTAQQAAQLEGELSAPGDNRTYVMFNKADTESAIRPIVEDAFKQAGVSVASWSAKGRDGIVLGVGPDDARLRPMEPNPLAMQAIHDAGLMVVPRISDRTQPYDAARVSDWLAKFKAVGATRIIFDGGGRHGIQQSGRPAEFGRLCQAAQGRWIRRRRHREFEGAAAWHGRAGPEA
ncbi:DUF5693 family protein [Cohnella rhizosphaerae]|uniref:DUF5693 family protein n=1 Tax=Cohnella rhizosphaerae TaxID=1457232 RepID=A0A9X4KVA4_9BACL|nr:DUF5693 family protein [Cohnella rhizosphaerae]MDG0811789.1 DUF5693 family protein [Cohnella rhizosphaerae]